MNEYQKSTQEISRSEPNKLELWIFNHSSFAKRQGIHPSHTNRPDAGATRSHPMVEPFDKAVAVA